MILNYFRSILKLLLLLFYKKLLKYGQVENTSALDSWLQCIGEWGAGLESTIRKTILIIIILVFFVYKWIEHVKSYSTLILSII
jgi:hypothetical protein